MVYTNAISTQILSLSTFSTTQYFNIMTGECTNLVDARCHSNHNTPVKHLAILAQYLLGLQLGLVMNMYPVTISSHLPSNSSAVLQTCLVMQIQLKSSHLNWHLRFDEKLPLNWYVHMCV